MRSHLLLLSLTLAIAALARPSIAAPAPAVAATPARGTATTLSTAQRQAVALMVAGRVERGLAAIPQRSPEQAVASLRSVARAYTGMARICSQANWAPMADYYTQTASVFAQMATGKLTRAQVDAKTRALELRRREVARAAIKRFGPAHVSPQDPQLNAIADRLATRVLHEAGA